MRLSSGCHALIAASLLLASGPGHASHAPRTLTTAVAQSDLIVLGTLEQVRPATDGGAITGYTGTIRIHEHLAGDAAKGRCTLTWTAPTRVPSGGVDHRAQAGKRGVWLLHREPGTARYLADHDGFVPLERLDRVRAAIAGPLFLVDTQGWGDSGRVCCVTLMIRTFLPRLVVRDFVSVSGDRLVRHGRAWLELADQMGKPIAARPGRVVPAAGSKPVEVVVTRDRPHRVQVDLRRAFPLAGRRRGEVLHFEWGASKEERSPSYTIGLE